MVCVTVLARTVQQAVCKLKIFLLPKPCICMYGSVHIEDEYMEI